MVEPKSEKGPSPWITVWMRDINHAHFFWLCWEIKKKKKKPNQKTKTVILSCDTFFGSVYEAGSVTVIITLSNQETFFFSHLFYQVARVCFPGGPSGKESACQCRYARDTGLVPGLGRSLGKGNDISLQYSCLENPMDRGAWRATVHGVAKTWTWLRNWQRDCRNYAFFPKV